MRSSFTVALLLNLVTSCSTPSKQKVIEALDRVTAELTVIKEVAYEIEVEYPETKPKVKLIKDSVSNIESELPVIKKEVGKFDKKVKEPTKFEAYLPWVLMAGGIAMLWFAISTPDRTDDFIGVIMCASSFVVAKWYTEIAIGAGIVLLLYLIIIGAKYFALRKTP